MFTLRPPEKPSWAVTGPETAPILNVLANFASNAGLARRGSYAFLAGEDHAYYEKAK